MKYLNRFQKVWSAGVVGLALMFSQASAMADTAQEINKEADIALENLYQTSPVAKKLASQANGVLVFPSITKAGLLVGGQYGEGVLRVNNETAGYYKSTSVSYGLQAGAQKFGYAMFLMTPEAMQYLDSSKGWELGVGPTVVFVDAGVAKSLTTSTAKEDIYVFIFDQKGLMAGIGLQGSKITKITPDE